MPQLKDKPISTKTAKNEQPQKAAVDFDKMTFNEVFGHIPHHRGKINPKTGAVVIDKSDPQEWQGWACNG